MVNALNFSLKKAIQSSADKAFKIIFRIFKSKDICSHILIAFTHFLVPENNQKEMNMEN